MTQSIWAQQALTNNGWEDNVTVTIDGQCIVGVNPDTAPAGHQVGLLLPSPSNLHSHAFQRAMAGLTERRGPDPNDSFWTWRRLMYRFLDQLGPDDIEAIAAFVQMEMAEAGYCAVAEFHYLHHQPNGKPYAQLAELSERVAAAADCTGLGLTLLPVLYQYGGCDQRQLGAGQVRFGNDEQRYSDLVNACENVVSKLPPDTRLGIAPHSLRAVSHNGLRLCSELASHKPLHLHLAEQIAEVEEVEAHYGARPADWLLANTDVDSSWCLIHCTQLNQDEIDALAATQAVVGLCPITEASLGDGIFDGVRYANQGGRFGIGSDSNVRISLSEELRLLEFSQRLRDRARAMFADANRSTARVLFDRCVQGGAQALGRDSGVIAPGKLADLLSLNTEAVDMIDRRADVALDCFVFAGDDSLVEDVWSAGRHIVKHGKHINAQTITQRYRDTMKRMRDVL